MTFLAGLLGGGAVSAVEAVGKVVDELFTSDDERLGKEALLARLAQRPSLAQLELNRVEAQHRSVFVAGWRPAVGWCCAAALFYNFVARDLIAWAMVNFAAGAATIPPALQMEQLVTVLLGMLGLGGLRTLEKLQGRAK